jgi:hypothetical protein
VSNRRRVERIDLDPCIHGSIGATAVRLVDLSLDGAGVEHDAPLAAGAAVRLLFTYGDARLELPSLTVRCRLQKSVTRNSFVYRSGLQFAELPADTRRTLRSVIHALILPELEKARVIPQAAASVA